MGCVEGGTEEPAAIGAEPSGPLAVPESAPVAAQSPVPAFVLPTKSHRGRFGIFYLALGALLAVAIAGVVVLATQPGKPKPKQWSAWSPASGSSGKVSSEIAAHVGSEYRLSGTGGQLVAVLSGSPEITHGVKTRNVSEVAFCDSPAAQRCSRVISTKGTVQEQLCGIGSTNCSISGAAEGTTLTRLLRREALELALYTFKYAPSVSSVIAFMPPAKGALPSTVLFLERNNLSQQLSEPLRKTLPVATPPGPESLDGSEATTIDHLTLPAEYQFDYVAISSSADAIVLSPGAA